MIVDYFDNKKGCKETTLLNKMTRKLSLDSSQMQKIHEAIQKSFRMGLKKCGQFKDVKGTQNGSQFSPALTWFYQNTHHILRTNPKRIKL
ncbi:unnamed protein product [Leptidea sinapis]|uniref:Uncharacterized protein n=1 Tax=Leptidea sinapis TaxID=189913 RepID=A0A5E4QMA1_9NEOP|nr:unnamed protein product [Leptidea sinapis]